jgi:ComF family protein
MKNRRRFRPLSFITYPLSLIPHPSSLIPRPSSVIPRLASLRPNWAALKAAGVDLLFPPRCVNCGEELAEHHDNVGLCDACCRLLAPQADICCRRCGAVGSVGGIVRESSAERCPLCRTTSLRFDTVIALGLYDGPLQQAVLRTKLPQGDSLAAAIGRLLAERRRQELRNLRADLIVPIPMHWSRRLRRGTNSPEILAAALRGELHLPLRHVLTRRRNTPEQKGLPPRARFHNVRGAFRLRRWHAVAGRRILLVDDVLTTGATCSAAAATLKAAGAAMVAVAVLARGQGAAK